MKINLHFQQRTFLWHLKRCQGSLYGFHKSLLRHRKQVQKQKFTSILTCGTILRMEELIIQTKMLKQRKTVVILNTLKFGLRYHLNFCSKES